MKRIVAKVNRTLDPKQVLNNTKRKQYVDQDVLMMMPRGEGDGAEVVFFKVGRYLNDNDLEKEFNLRGFKPADAYSLSAVNEEDPAFADTHPNATVWKDVDGKWCYVAFFQWNGRERDVSVKRSSRVWSEGWWFAGIRK